MMFWDRVAFVYDLFAQLYNSKTHRILCEIVSGMIVPTDDVLECACGTGMLSMRIAPRCRSLIATDISPNMLIRARKKCRAFKNVSFHLADMMRLGYRDEKFDAVIAANVIHLLDDPRAALRELERVCKPGGRLIIPTYVVRDASDPTRLIQKAAEKKGAVFKNQFTYESYQRFFADAGYRDVDYSLAEGRVACAVAVLRKRPEMLKSGK